MKNTIALTLSLLIFACALSGCGNSTQNSDQPITENSSQPSDSETANPASEDSDSETSPFHTTDTVSVVFDGETVTVTYRGTPESYFYDQLDKGIYTYMKLYFTYEEESLDNAGVFQLETNGDGNVSSLMQFGDYKLTDGEVSFGENGFPMTCVFSGTKDEIAGMLSSVDMNGKIKVNDSLYNNYYVAYVKDAITEE